jgi:predicted NBD/HSP70 family sugar kinase
MDGGASRVGEVRRANLSRILRLVHEGGPRSRAALTESTGLNRSTIADLVGALERDGLVREQAPPPAKRAGRPSPVVAPHPEIVAIAANPEVDALEIAAVRLDRTIAVRERIAMSGVPSAQDVVALITERVAAWRAGALAGARVAGLGVAMPGLVRTDDGAVRSAPHLDWREVPLRTMLEDATGLFVAVANDANLGILAEHRFGAAREVADVVYLNGGASGIGGALVVAGVPVTGAGGYAGEFGQNRPRIAAEADRRTSDGTLEDEVSRARLLEVLGLNAVDDPTLAAALLASDAPAVRAEIARQRRILSTALANAANVLNPSAIVLGGFLAALAERDLPSLVRDVAAQTMPANAEQLDVRVASLAEDRLLIGAAEAAFEDLLFDPASGTRDDALSQAR